MLRDFDAKDNAVRVGNADGLLAGEFPRQVVESKRRSDGIFPKCKKCLFGLAAEFWMLSCELCKCTVDWAVHDMV